MSRKSKSPALPAVSHKESMTKQEALQLIKTLSGGHNRTGYRKGMANAAHHNEVAVAERRLSEAQKRNKAYYETPTAKKLLKEQEAAQNTYYTIQNYHADKLHLLLSRVEATVLLEGVVSNETKELLRTIIDEYTA